MLSFRDKLKNLRAKEEDEQRIKELKIEQEKKKREAEQRRIKSELGKLISQAQKEIAPFLQEVNSTYLGGRGQVSVNTSSGCETLEETLKYSRVSIRLRWDEYDSFMSWGHKELELSLGFDQTVRIKGSSEEKEIQTNDVDWRQKLEDQIMVLLESGNVSYHGEKSLL